MLKEWRGNVALFAGCCAGKPLALTQDVHVQFLCAEPGVSFAAVFVTSKQW